MQQHFLDGFQGYSGTDVLRRGITRRIRHQTVLLLGIYHREYVVDAIPKRKAAWITTKLGRQGVHYRRLSWLDFEKQHFR